MCKFLFWVKNYVYKACNPTILNLSKVKEKISLELLDYRPKINYSSLFGLCCAICSVLHSRLNWTVIETIQRSRTHDDNTGSVWVMQRPFQSLAASSVSTQELQTVFNNLFTRCLSVTSGSCWRRQIPTPLTCGWIICYVRKCKDYAGSTSGFDLQLTYLYKCSALPIKLLAYWKKMGVDGCWSDVSNTAVFLLGFESVFTILFFYYANIISEC
jgi:hypothetical protein